MDSFKVVENLPSSPQTASPRVVAASHLDIIIPVLNEEKILEEECAYYSQLGSYARLVFVDGGSRDRTVEIAKRYGEVICSRQGRAFQKNAGADATRSSHLLFLHVDSKIDFKAIEKIVSLMDNGASGGCLKMKIEDERLIFRLYENIVNFRAKYLGVYDGDLGLFVNRQIFNHLGQFELLPVMDDIVFSKKLRKTGSSKLIDCSIYVSSRKWYELGFIKTFSAYTLAYIQLWTGIPFFKGHPVDEKRN